MFLGTSRRWWIAAGLVIVLGLWLVGAGVGGGLGTAAGVALLLLGLGLFAAAPMRYGASARKPPGGTPSPDAPRAANEFARPRPEFEARDPSEV